MSNHRLHRELWVENFLTRIFADFTRMVADISTIKSAYIRVQSACIRVQKEFFKNLTQVIFLVSVLWFLVSYSYAEPISSKELIQNAKEFDGKEVVFQGEVIGDVMKRGNSCWVNISDGEGALGVFLENSLLSDIMFTGDYNHIGDIVEVKGIFHRACLTYGGDLDIHAAKIIKLKDGYRIIHKTDQKKVKAVLWLAAILFGLIIIVAIKRYSIKSKD